MRDSMIFYRSFYEAIKELPLDTQGEIYNAIFCYGLDFQVPELSGVSKTIWTLIKPQIDANIKRFENGKKPKIKQIESKTEAKDKQDESKSVTNNNNNVNNNDNVNVNNKPSFKKEAKRELAVISESIQIIYPFNTEKFINAWNEWKEYKKKELKQSYKTTISEGKVLRQLATESGNNEEVAIQMIEQAIVRGWKGIYKLQNQNTNQNGTETRTDGQNNAVEQFRQRIVSAVNK